MTRDTMAPMSAPAEGRAWNSVLVHEWMWAPEGLGLGHGADLFVYAALYAATEAGTLTYRAPCAALGATIGYARETVQRSLTHLCTLDLVWSPDGRTTSGGTPRTYAISPGPLAMARGEQRRDASEPTVAQLSVASDVLHISDHASRDSRTPAISCTSLTRAGTKIVGGSPCAPISHPTTSNTAPSGSDVPAQMTRDRDDASRAAMGTRDGTSQTGGDDTSRPLTRHTLENAVPPALMPVGVDAPISSFLLSPDTPDTSGDPCLEKAGTRTLTLAEFAAFETLVGNSLLPVDDAFLKRNLDAFTEIVASGIPADAIVEAYDDYAAYQRSRYRKSGTWRPMHLLHWLQANPNGNVDFVMRRREIEAQRRSCTTGRSGIRTNTGTICSKKQAPHRRGPRLTQCRDRGRALWFVDDDHGSRRVEGAEGVEDLGEATRIYEQMYARECQQDLKAA